jgi:hypothetical protein
MRLTPGEDIGTTVPPEAHRIANLAYREARDEGCNCPEPEVEMRPIAELPYWSAVVKHDETCALIVKLRRHGAGL